MWTFSYSPLATEHLKHSGVSVLLSNPAGSCVAMRGGERRQLSGTWDQVRLCAAQSGTACNQLL